MNEDEPERPRVPLMNIIPPRLVDVVKGDPIVYAMFVRASFNGSSREDALIECVIELAKDRARMTEMCQDIMSKQGASVLVVKP